MEKYIGQDIKDVNLRKTSCLTMRMKLWKRLT